MSEVELLKRIADDVAFLKEKVSHMESLLGEIVYPREDRIKQTFIESVTASERRITKGEGLEFKNMDEFLESVEE